VLGARFALFSISYMLLSGKVVGSGG